MEGCQKDHTSRSVLSCLYSLVCLRPTFPNKLVTCPSAIDPSGAPSRVCAWRAGCGCRIDRWDSREQKQSQKQCRQGETGGRLLQICRRRDVVGQVDSSANGLGTCTSTVLEAGADKTLTDSVAGTLAAMGTMVCLHSLAWPHSGRLALLA